MGRSFDLLSAFLYVFVDTNWKLSKDSQQSCKSLHFFCTKINNYIYIVFTCEAHSLKIIFSLLCLLNHCCLVAVSFPTLLQPQGL